MNDTFYKIHEGVAYDPTIEAIVIYDDEMLAKQHSFTKHDSFEDACYEDDLITWWGVDNLTPNRNLKQVSQSTDFLPAIKEQAKLIISGGLQLYETTTKTLIEEYDYPETAKFFHKAIEQHGDFQYEFFYNYLLFNLVFVEFITNKFGDKILSAKVLPTHQCRFGKQNEKGTYDYIIYSKNWHRYNRFADEKFFAKIPLQQIGGIPKTKKFVVALKLDPLQDKPYPTPEWNAILYGWLSVNLKIPQLKKAILENAIMPKFIIKISNKYWPLKFHDWTEKREEQDERRKQIHKELNDKLRGVEKAGNNIFVPFDIDEFNKKTEFIEIVALDNQGIQDTYFNESGIVADYKMYNAIGFPSSLSNNLNNNKRVGADVLEDFNKYQVTTVLERKAILRIFNWVLEVNKENGYYGYGQVYMNTLTSANASKTAMKYEN